MSCRPNKNAQQQSDDAHALTKQRTKPNKSYLIAKAAHFNTTASNTLVDPAVVNEPGFDERIATFISATSFTQFATTYNCATQAKAQPDQLYLGWDGRVTLWKEEATVNFATYAGGYATENHAVYAAKMWNDREVGVKFKWVGKLEDAEFVLTYGGDADGTLARAFFPNTKDLNTVFVYKRAFDSDTVRYQANIFAHELGHAIGLGHEFAPEEGDHVLFGPRNPNSVMSYKFPPTIQASDIDIVNVKLLYKLDEGCKIENYPVNRVEPDN